MFTGIVQKVGRVLDFQPTSDQSFTLKMSKPFTSDDPVELGESIAHNGVCLTVTAQGADWMTFDLAPETVKRTALSRLKPGSMVNLERSLRMGDRLSGHWVQGHVDGVARVTLVQKVDTGRGAAHDYFDLAVELQDPSLRKYCVKKGSISIDGISLTIHEIRGSELHFQIIPHTWSHTALPDLKSGDLVNIEVDILAKYAENFSVHTPTSSRD
jgi:riboflavin synthase